ncbi:hypothetical protein EV646_114162 [Kribbella antiqua]|uniref:Uncharacterized protein n=1 Tax=Kribbella antiqua TaxID=2512217 RepID=A0A4R2IFB2_9ACTN|nr:hypothetical protein [Kribbella antiqua]TCO42338.1 hypothetical protein EV646_114162 [Kribbella antiqua]
MDMKLEVVVVPVSNDPAWPTLRMRRTIQVSVVRGMHGARTGRY